MTSPDDTNEPGKPLRSGLRSPTSPHKPEHLTFSETPPDIKLLPTVAPEEVLQDVKERMEHFVLAVSSNDSHPGAHNALASFAGLFYEDEMIAINPQYKKIQTLIAYELLEALKTHCENKRHHSLELASYYWGKIAEAITQYLDAMAEQKRSVDNHHAMHDEGWTKPLLKRSPSITFSEDLIEEEDEDEEEADLGYASGNSTSRLPKWDPNWEDDDPEEPLSPDNKPQNQV